jgi:DNA-binding transcriptional LysR family regulator
MDIENLRTFYAVTQYKSFQKAADILLVTQSGISRRIQALENELGVPLLLRTPQSVTLTKQGSDFLPYAERVIHIMDEGTKVVKDEKEEEFILAVPSSAYDFLPKLIKEFIVRHPTRLTVYSTTSQQVYEMLIDHSVDIGITTAIFPSPHIKYERICSEETICVANPDFIKEYIVEGKIIKSPIPYVFVKMHKFRSLPWSTLFESISTNPMLKIIVEVNLFQLAIGLIRNGVGMGILPISEVRDAINAGELIKVDLPNMECPIRPAYMATYKKHHKNKVLLQFQKTVRQFSDTCNP